MRVDILASGSSGNCIALTSGKNTILIDVGIAKTLIDKRLVAAKIQPMNVRAIFITHAHGDHIKGLPLANKYRIPVYASEGEWKSIDTVDEELMRVVKAGKGIDFQNLFYIEAFHTHHDAYEPLGYAINDYDGNKCSICLDTGHVDEDMIKAMEFSCTYIIEANHDPRMVEHSDYPDKVKARVLSNMGHLSNHQTADALSRLVQGLGEQIYLTHLSSKNNMPMLAEMTTKRALLKKGLKPQKNYEIEVIY